MPFDGFMPHGHCYLWKPGMVWLQVASNGSIGIAYVSISATLGYLVYCIRNLPFQWIYIAFGLFIVSCGFTHFMDVWTVWQPYYWLDGGVRLVTAVASVGTAVVLPTLVPKAVALAKGAQVAREKGVRLETAYRELGDVLEKTKQLDDLKTQFFANVSHELRTPLALILGPVERLRGGPNLTDEQRRDLQLVSRNAGTLLRHVNELLDIAKLEAGKLHPVYVRADIAEVIRLATGNFDGLAIEKRIAFTVEVPAVLSADFDPDMIQRVVINLLANAFRAVPEGGGVDVRTDLRGDVVTISVGDSGPGIPDDMREAIFERFRQIDGSRAGGAGLGLAIVKEFVELHHGTVAVGRGPRGGALFTFQIPRFAPAGATFGASMPRPLSSAMSEQAVETLRQSTRRLEGAGPLAGEASPLVLIVEDNQDMNRFMAETLSRDYRVAQAFDGREGQEMAVRDHPDLIITDIMMPVMGGDQMVAAIRSDRGCDGIPILVLTAKADDDLKNRLLREGAQDYVVKPFSPDEVLTRTRNLVAMKRAREALQHELTSQMHDLEGLAREVSSRRRELEATVADLRVAKEDAERASNAKSAFLGLVSHEMKTPVTALKLQLQILRRLLGQDASTRQRDMIERLDRSSDRTIEMMDTLLTYTKLWSGRIEPSPTSFDVGQMMAELVEVFRPQAQEKGLRLELSVVEALPPLVNDRFLVQMVVRNLVANAVKYTDSGQVTVSVDQLEGKHRISVADTGAGIPEDQREAIFEPFLRITPLEKKTKAGFGLGLTIARDCAAAIGGKIELTSEVGKGSTFTAVFGPLAIEPASR